MTKAEADVNTYRLADIKVDNCQRYLLNNIKSQKTCLQLRLQREAISFSRSYYLTLQGDEHMNIL